MTTQKNSAAYLQECRDALASEQAQSLSQTNNWSHVNKEQVHLDWDALYKELVPLVQVAAPTSPEVQAMMARHYAIVSRFYAPSRSAYIGMSLFYSENQDMKNFHDAYHPDMVAFLVEAMSTYAHSEL